MRVNLKSLFILVAIAAAISLWLSQRRTPFYSGLVQIVEPVPTNRTAQERNTDFEDAFYSLLISNLTADHPETLSSMSDPNIQLREVIRLEPTPHSGSARLYTVQALGNALTSDRERLEMMMKNAVEALNTLSNDQSRPFLTKILVVPSL